MDTCFQSFLPLINRIVHQALLKFSPSRNKPRPQLVWIADWYSSWLILNWILAIYFFLFVAFGWQHNSTPNKAYSRMLYMPNLSASNGELLNEDTDDDGVADRFSGGISATCCTVDVACHRSSSSIAPARLQLNLNVRVNTLRTLMQVLHWSINREKENAFDKRLLE